MGRKVSNSRASRRTQRLFVVILNNTIELREEPLEKIIRWSRGKVRLFFLAQYLNFVAKRREAEALVIKRWHKVLPFHHLVGSSSVRDTQEQVNYSWQWLKRKEWWNKQKGQWSTHFFRMNSSNGCTHVLSDQSINGRQLSSVAMEWAQRRAPIYRGSPPSCLTSGGLIPEGRDPACVSSFHMYAECACAYAFVWHGMRFSQWHT
jgi:hypothetical protein